MRRVPEAEIALFIEYLTAFRATPHKSSNYRQRQIKTHYPTPFQSTSLLLFINFTTFALLTIPSSIK